MFALLALALLAASAETTSPKGSFGFLLNLAQTQTDSDSGTAILGLMNFDGVGAVSGSLTLQPGSNDTKAAQTTTVTFTGTYAMNSDGTGSMTITLDGVDVSLTFAFVVTDGGQGLQLVATNLTGGDISGAVISGVARPAYAGPLQGSYGFQLNNSPTPAGTIGVVSFDGTNQAVVSFTSIGAPPGGSQPPVSMGTLTGTYVTNPDGSGTINLPAASGQSANSAFAMVVIDGGSALQLLLTDGTGYNVSFGTARRQ